MREIVDQYSKACPKFMKNGPCGGVRNGFCEVAGRGKCVWVVIYETLGKDEFVKIYE